MVRAEDIEAHLHGCGAVVLYLCGEHVVRRRDLRNARADGFIGIAGNVRIGDVDSSSCLARRGDGAGIRCKLKCLRLRALGDLRHFLGAGLIAGLFKIVIRKEHHVGDGHVAAVRAGIAARAVEEDVQRRDRAAHCVCLRVDDIDDCLFPCCDLHERAAPFCIRAQRRAVGEDCGLVIRDGIQPVGQRILVRAEDIEAHLHGCGAVVLYLCGEHVVRRRDLRNARADGLIGIAGDVRIGDVDRSSRLVRRGDRVCIRFKEEFLRLRALGDLRHIPLIRLVGVIVHVHFGARLDPLVFGALVAGVGVRAHPALGIRGAAPIVHQDAAGSCGHGRIFGGLHLIDGLAVHEPADVVLRPAEAVVVELFGGVEAEVIRVLVLAHAADVIVELHLGRILAQKLDVDLVPRVLLAVEVGVVIARAGEEGAGGARLFGGLHAHFEVAVAVPLVGARLAAEVLVVGRFSAVRVLVDGQLERILAEHVIVRIPLRVEHASV